MAKAEARPTARGGWPVAGGALVIALAGLFVYWPALNGAWMWDDDYEIIHSPLLRHPDGWWKIWFGINSPDYFPLKTEMQWVQWRLWGDHVLGYHLVNLGFHLLAAYLFWRVLDRLAGAGMGFLGALLFTVHPLAVESVAWISELKNVTSLCGMLLAFLAYLKRWSASSPTRCNVPALAWFLAALLCKSSVVMFPVTLLLYEWWRRGRIGWAEIKTVLPFFGVSLLIGLVAIWFQAHRAIGGEDLHLGGFWWHLGSAGMVIAFYLGRCLVPVGWMPIYHNWGPQPVLAAPLACWAGLILLAGWLWNRRASYGRTGLFALGFFVANLLPVLGFVAMSFLRISRVADHLCYISLLGFCGLAGVLLARHRGLWGVAGLIVAALCLLSRSEAGAYRDTLAFWSRGVRGNPGSWLAQNNYGNALFDVGRNAEAEAAYQRAVEILPDYPEAQNNLGNMLLNRGQIQEAMKRYAEALRLLPTYTTPHNGIGLALLRTGHPAEALEQFRQASAGLAPSPEAHYNMGLCLARLNRLPEAIAEYQDALRSRPLYPEALCDLGAALEAEGDRQHAIECFRASLRLNPNYGPAHFNLAAVLYETGQLEESANEFRTALRFRPDFAPAHRQLGLVLRELGRTQEADAELAEAVRLDARRGGAR